MRRVVVVLAAALLSGGCALDRIEFRPRESVSAESPTGRPAAAYRLEAETGDGPMVAEVRVWSDGAERTDGSGVVLRVGFEIESRSSGPLSLVGDEVRAVVHDDAGRDVPLVPDEAGLTVEVPPDSVVRHTLTFRCPPDVALDDLATFDLHWVIVDAEAGRYREVTPFRRWVPPAPRREVGTGFFFTPYHFGYHHCIVHRDPWW